MKIIPHPFSTGNSISMNCKLPQDNGHKHSCPSSSRGSWRHISHQVAALPGSQLLPGTMMSLPEPHLFWRGTRESVTGSLSACSVPHAFPPVLIKILCDLFTANTIHYAQAGRNNQLVFQAMIFSQEIDVEHSQFCTSISSSRILQRKCGSHFLPFTVSVHLMQVFISLSFFWSVGFFNC